MYFFIDKRCLLKYFPMIPAVACQPLSKLCRFAWVCFWTISFKNLIIPPPREKTPPPIPPHLEKIPQVDAPPNFYCFYQKWIPPPLNNNFHVINQKGFFFCCSNCCCTACVCLRPCTAKSPSASNIWDCQGTDQRCFVEDVGFLCRFPSSLLWNAEPNLSANRFILLVH